MINVDPLYANEVERKVLELREVLIRFDENEKALKLMTECVPYIVASRPHIEMAIDKTKEQNAHLIDTQAYHDYYANNPHEAPFETMYGQPAEKADEILPRVGWLRGRLGVLPLEVLDFACNDGMLAAVLTQDGHSVHGVDLNPACIMRAKDRHIKNATFEEGDFLLDDYARRDVVVAFEVIEHVPDPKAMIDAMAKACRPLGRLYVSTPMGAVEGGNIEDWDVLEPKGHVRSFTPRQFYELLNEYGTVELVVGADRTMIAEVQM